MIKIEIKSEINFESNKKYVDEYIYLLKKNTPTESSPGYKNTFLKLGT